MKIEKIFTFTHSEREFLKALSKKPYPENRWSGRGTDDSFNIKWKNEKKSFSDAGLTTKIDSGYEGDYWCYGLTSEGEIIQNLVLKGDTKIVIETTV
jgi:hypothetical protein